MVDRPFASLVPRLQPSVPGCPYATIVQYIRDSAIKTCERTLAWRHAEPPYALTPGVYEYPYRKPAEADVHAVFLATVNNAPLEHLTLDAAVALYPAWADLYGGVPLDQLWSGTGAFNGDAFNEQTFNGGAQFTLPPEALEGASEPRSITQLTPDQFVLLPAPNADKEYKLRLLYALKPKRTAAGMPQAIFDELETAILHGALQDLLVLPQVPWTDRELASFHAKQYVFHAGERRARANLGTMRGTLAVSIRPFA
jgi:hypothetical protein